MTGNGTSYPLAGSIQSAISGYPCARSQTPARARGESGPVWLENAALAATTSTETENEIARLGVSWPFPHA